MKRKTINDKINQVIDYLEEGFVLSYEDGVAECYFFDKIAQKFYYVQNDPSIDAELRKGFTKNDFLEHLNLHWKEEFSEFIFKIEQNKLTESTETFPLK